jgi:L-cystine uptake protein TcyP (sodium:dicarboxylate symporter family)
VAAIFLFILISQNTPEEMYSQEVLVAMILGCGLTGIFLAGFAEFIQLVLDVTKDLSEINQNRFLLEEYS